MSPPLTAALFGLATALCFGTGDFAAQRLVARAGWRRSLLIVHLAALPLVLALALALDGAPRLDLDGGARLLALGLLNILGLVALYRAFAVGVLSVVAPIASSFAAVTVALAALAGRAPTAPTLLGLAAIVVGVAAVSAGHGGHGGDARRPGGAGVAWACLSSLSLGAVFFGLEDAAAALGPRWPIVALRAIGALVLLALSLRPAAPATAGVAPVWHLVLLSALLDTGGMVVYAEGARRGEIAVLAVIASLFSVVTVALAQARLRERLGRVQWIGVALLLLGTAWVVARQSAG